MFSKALVNPHLAISVKLEPKIGLKHKTRIDA